MIIFCYMPKTVKFNLEIYKNELPLEKESIETRTLHDIESLRELGMCPGIETYSMHIDNRNYYRY